MRELGTIAVKRIQHTRWKRGELAPLGAIILHHATGHHALISKYEFTNRKQRVVEELLPVGVVGLLRDRVGHGRAQAPDLLMYALDRSSYFFCEVKGPADRVSKAQESKFEALGRLTARDVCLLRFAWFSDCAQAALTPIKPGRAGSLIVRPTAEMR
jgi:hypothetical protein